MALNLTGKVLGAGGVVLNRIYGQVGGVIHGPHRTQRLAGNNPRSDIEARQAASTQTNPVASTHTP